MTETKGKEKATTLDNPYKTGSKSQQATTSMPKTSERRTPETGKMLAASRSINLIIPDHLPGDVERWNQTAVIQFLYANAKQYFLLGKHIKVIEDQEVVGAALLELTEERLMQDGLKRGPALIITMLVKKLKENKGLIEREPSRGVRRSRSPSTEQPVKKPRNFRTANKVDPNSNFYIEPTTIIHKLGGFLLGGKYSLVYGHRQSGKTTTIYATADWLASHSQIELSNFARGLEVYVISFDGGLKLRSGVDAFWESVCRKLEALNEKRFFYDKGEQLPSATFERFFRRKEDSRPVILFIDEGSALINQDSEIIDDFMGVLRLLKDGCPRQYCLFAFAFIGIATIKELLRPRPESKNKISPFSVEATVEPDRFTEADIKKLLDEYMKESAIEFDSAGIAGDIFERTLGHKGLTGACCSRLEMMPSRLNTASISLDDWEQEAVNLVEIIPNWYTYDSIVKSLNDLTEERRNIIGNVLRRGSLRLFENDDVLFLLAEGMIIVTKREGKAVVIECAAPILRSMMISHITRPNFEVEPPPDPLRLDAQWLLIHTIENMAIQHVFAEQTVNSTTGQPSEYAFQTEFIATMQRLLSLAHPGLLYRVLPECKERDEYGNRHQHLDILLRDGSNPRYGFEFVVEATETVFDEHCKRAEYYSKVHKCSMYMVHLCTRNHLSGHFGPSFQDVTPVHVIYDINTGLADLVFKDNRKSVQIKSSAWQVMFN